MRSLPHEFRTPLHAILGYAQILQEETDLPAGEVKEIGAMLHKSAQRLHHLLENMILLRRVAVLMNDQKAITTMRRESITSLREVIRSAAKEEAGAQKRSDSIDIQVKDSVCSNIFDAPDKDHRRDNEQCIKILTARNENPYYN